MNYSRTASAVAVVAVLVTVPALVLGGAVVIGGESEPAAAPAVTGPGPGEAVPTAAATTEPGPGPASEAAALQCTNGTSGTVVACGYDPGPTTVALEHIESGGATATIRAVELESGGFVAVHTDGDLRGDPPLHLRVEHDELRGVVHRRAGHRRRTTRVHLTRGGHDRHGQ
jgi:hypothetical protein